jgi:hypothetical protein
MVGLGHSLPSFAITTALRMACAHNSAARMPSDPLGTVPKFVFLERDLGDAGRVVERMQRAGESLPLLLRFGRAARRHELAGLAQRIAGVSARD